MSYRASRRRRRDLAALRTRPALLAVTALLTTGYTIQTGDTLERIARDTGSSVRDLADANQLDDPDRIVAGRELAIPAAEPEAGSGAPSGAEPAPPPPAAVDRAEVAALLESTARQHGWSPAFVKAVAWQESGWQQDRVSSAGAVGVMQVLPSTGDFVSRNLAGRELDLHDPADNVLAGVLFLDYLHGLTGGDVELLLAGYYQGLRSVRINGVYDDTERYIDNVMALRERFR